MGVQLFNIPVYPVEIPVSANVNKNAGRKFPSDPTMESFQMLFHVSFLKAFIVKGSRNNAAILMRKAATCVCVNIVSPEVVSMPSFIRMKLLPQIEERTIRRIQLLNEVFTVQKYRKQ